MIHLVEGEKPEEWKIVRAKCGKDLVFRPFSPTLNKRMTICSDCDNRGPTKIPNYLAVLETPLSKKANP